MSEKIKLGDYVSIKTGKLDANASKTNGQYPFFTCSIQPLRIDNYSYDCECVLVAGNGDLNVKYYNGKFDAYQRTYIIESINKKVMNNRYLYYLINSKIEHLRNNSIGGVIKYIKLGNLTNIEFNKIDIQKQEECVNLLDKMQEIIDIRKLQIEKLDELIKSQFVEMFGDPFINNKNWEVKELKDISSLIADGSNVDKNLYKTKSDVLFLRIQNVWRNEFRLDDSVYISAEENKGYYDTSLKHGDLLICKIGRNYTKDTSLGRVSIYLGEDDKANYSNNIMRIRLKNDVNCEYINLLLNLKDYQEHIKRVSKGGTDKRALNKSIIGSLPIILPPRNLQDEYINKVHQIDKQKFEIQKSLKEMKKLQGSLTNKYFG